MIWDLGLEYRIAVVMKSSCENIGNIGISAITNIGVSAYRQKCHIGTPLAIAPGASITQIMVDQNM